MRRGFILRAVLQQQRRSIIKRKNLRGVREGHSSCKPAENCCLVQKGSNKFHDQYGARLVCVRYRCDAVRHRRYTTVELIAEEVPWVPLAKLAGETMLGLHVTFQEVELQRRVKRAGGKWNPERRLWELRYDQVVRVGAGRTD